MPRDLGVPLPQLPPLRACEHGFLTGDPDDIGRLAAGEPGIHVMDIRG